LPNEVPTPAESTAAPHLRRVLGRRDLILLFVVAVFNLNVVPSIAANGGVTVWLWLISLALFFWPQGIAVIELAHRYPGEGGVYLWAKEVFGDFHGFLSGWCYWTNNMMYVPTVMLYSSCLRLVLGPNHAGPADTAISHSPPPSLLLLLVILNIVGLGVGKWINNLGGSALLSLQVADRPRNNLFSCPEPVSPRPISAFPPTRASS
jgi:amino acid transporter